MSGKFLRTSRGQVFFVVALFAVLFAFSALLWTYLTGGFDRYAYPPTVRVDGINYHNYRGRTAELPETAGYVGVIRSTVPATALPQEDLQTNDSSFAGAEVYYEEGTIWLSTDTGEWAVFQSSPLEESAAQPPAGNVFPPGAFFCSFLWQDVV